MLWLNIVVLILSYGILQIVCRTTMQVSASMKWIGHSGIKKINWLSQVATLVSLMMLGQLVYFFICVYSLL